MCAQWSIRQSFLASEEERTQRHSSRQLGLGRNVRYDPSMLRSVVVWMALVLVLSAPAFAGEEATLVLYGGQIITMQSPGDIQEAIAIADDRILAVGSASEILALAGESTEVVDLRGRVVLPGFVDPHTHLLNDSWNAGLSPIESQELALRNGITTAANMYTTPSFLEEVIALARAGQLRLRCSLYLIYNTSCGEILGHWYLDQEPLIEMAPRLRIGGIKIFSETSVCGDQRIGISFTEPLRQVLSPAGQAWYGVNRPLFNATELAEVIETVQEAGFPVAIHAIGDGGIQLCLDAFEKTSASHPSSIRHAVLHNLFIRDDLLMKYEELDVVAAIESTSPCFTNVYQDLLPLEFKHIVRRWKDLADSGALVAADSDWPWSAEEAISPLFRLQALMSPVNHSGSYAEWEPCGTLPEDQLLSAWQGLQMMTVNAATMLHMEQEIGTLVAGKLADLVVLSENPLTAPVEELTAIDVLLTVVNGVQEYRAQALK